MDIRETNQLTTNLYVGDGKRVSDTEGRALVGCHLASNILQQVLDLAGHQSLALLQLLLLMKLKLKSKLKLKLKVELKVESKVMLMMVHKCTIFRRESVREQQSYIGAGWGKKREDALVGKLVFGKRPTKTQPVFTSGGGGSGAVMGPLPLPPSLPTHYNHTRRYRYGYRPKE